MRNHICPSKDEGASRQEEKKKHNNTTYTSLLLPPGFLSRRGAISPPMVMKHDCSHILANTCYSILPDEKSPRTSKNITEPPAP